jgi:putative flippase GtrA
MHRRLVFRVRGHLWLDLARFETVNLGMLAANAVLLPFCVEVLGFGVLVAQGCSTVVTVVMSYLGHSLFSFRRPAAAPSTSEQDPENCSGAEI